MITYKVWINTDGVQMKISLGTNPKKMEKEINYYVRLLRHKMIESIFDESVEYPYPKDLTPEKVVYKVYGKEIDEIYDKYKAYGPSTVQASKLRLSTIGDNICVKVTMPEKEINNLLSHNKAIEILNNAQEVFNVPSGKSAGDYLFKWIRKLELEEKD